MASSSVKSGALRPFQEQQQQQQQVNNNNNNNNWQRGKKRCLCP